MWFTSLDKIRWRESSATLFSELWEWLNLILLRKYAKIFSSIARSLENRWNDEYSIYLTVDENNWAEKSPRAALPIDMEHSKDLQETNSSNGARGKHLSIAT